MLGSGVALLVVQIFADIVQRFAWQRLLRHRFSSNLVHFPCLLPLEFLKRLSGLTFREVAASFLIEWIWEIVVLFLARPR